MNHATLWATAVMFLVFSIVMLGVSSWARTSGRRVLAVRLFAFACGLMVSAVVFGLMSKS